jgi:hypothetical protein
VQHVLPLLEHLTRFHHHPFRQRKPAQGREYLYDETARTAPSEHRFLLTDTLAPLRDQRDHGNALTVSKETLRFRIVLSLTGGISHQLHVIWYARGEISALDVGPLHHPHTIVFEVRITPPLVHKLIYGITTSWLEKYLVKNDRALQFGISPLTTSYYSLPMYFLTLNSISL